jgi:hypothetical protein
MTNLAKIRRDLRSDDETVAERASSEFEAICDAQLVALYRSTCNEGHFATNRDAILGLQHAVELMITRYGVDAPWPTREQRDAQARLDRDVESLAQPELLLT